MLPRAARTRIVLGFDMMRYVRQFARLTPLFALGLVLILVLGYYASIALINPRTRAAEQARFEDKLMARSLECNYQEGDSSFTIEAGTEQSTPEQAVEMMLPLQKRPFGDTDYRIEREQNGQQRVIWIYLNNVRKKIGQIIVVRNQEDGLWYLSQVDRCIPDPLGS
jgi:hypothetical protein